MGKTEQIPETYDEAVRLLARWYSENREEENLRIYSFPDSQGQIVRLVQVSDAIADLGGVHVYRIGKSDEFPFRSAVALASSDQWEKIANDPQVRAKLLPEDWLSSSPEQVWP